MLPCVSEFVIAFSWKIPAKFCVGSDAVLIKQTKPGEAISGPGANKVRFGELSNGKKPSSRLVARLDRRYPEPPLPLEDTGEAEGVADGAENSATTSIIHPTPLTPTDEPSCGVRIVTLLGMFCALAKLRRATAAPNAL